MRWTFESHTVPGLRVIEEIPDFSCLLEGKNGIGKTVSVQLLDLLSGDIPADFQRHPRLWGSLKERIGPTKVTIEGLASAKKLEATFSPDAWPDKVPESIGEWLASVRIDGKPSTMEAASAAFAVVRIAGNEDLKETLRRRVDTVESFLLQAAELVRERSVQVDETIGDLRLDFEATDPNQVDVELAAVERADRNLQTAQRKSAQAATQLNNLIAALEVRRKLHAMGTRAETLASRRDELKAEIVRLETEGEQLEKAAAAASKAFAAEGGAQKRLAEAEGLLRNRRSRLAKLEIQVADAAALLDVVPKTPDIRQALKSTQQAIVDLKQRHREIDTTGLVRNIIAEVLPPLTGAGEEAADQILIRTASASLTVAETASGILARRTEIAERPQPSQLRDLEAELASLKGRERKLHDLGSTVEKRDRAFGNVEDALGQVEAAGARARVASENEQQYTEANRALGANEDRISELHLTLAKLQNQIASVGAISHHDAEADLKAALAELGLEIDDLEGAEPRARKASAEADARLTEAQDQLAAARRRLKQAQTSIEALVQELLTSPAAKWLLKVDGLRAALGTEQTRIEAYKAVRAGVLAAADAGHRAERMLDNLAGVARQYFDQRPTSSQLQQGYRPAFEKTISESLREQLNRPAIANALFGGGRVVSIDPLGNDLTYVDAKGRETRKPLEAFSTGEQAFAFTQARISGLEPSGKPDTLLVLDEFGAFVAADRLPDLAAFLKDVDAKIADQIVVILPLHVDYANEIKDTRGELKVRYERALEQINARGYCVRELA